MQNLAGGIEALIQLQCGVLIGRLQRGGGYHCRHRYQNNGDKNENFALQRRLINSFQIRQPDRQSSGVGSRSVERRELVFAGALASRAGHPLI